MFSNNVLTEMSGECLGASLGFMTNLKEINIDIS